MKTDAVIARRVLRFLEDRRMLFNAAAEEDLAHCVLSTKQIREKLTSELEELPETSELLPYLRAMRASARDFMTKFPNATFRMFPAHEHSLQELALLIHLGQLRRDIGLQVALIAIRWQMDVENDLARVLPTFE